MRVICIKRKSLYLIISVLIILIILLSILHLNSKAVPTMNILIADKIIGIDPGHGGIDSGAIGPSGIEEAEINLKIALKLRDIIVKNGGKVVLTRETEEGLYTAKSKSLKEMKTEDLHNRKEIIERGNCDILISIHLNSFEQSKYYGAQTFYGKDNLESQKLALSIQNQLREVLDKDNKRVPQELEDVFLINNLDIPAIVVECGFLSNPTEEQLLADEDYQKKIALAIYNGIVKYFLDKENTNI